jgi:hypothetical protein
VWTHLHHNKTLVKSGNTQPFHITFECCISGIHCIRGNGFAEPPSPVGANIGRFYTMCATTTCGYCERLQKWESQSIHSWWGQQCVTNVASFKLILKNRKYANESLPTHSHKLRQMGSMQLCKQKVPSSDSRSPVAAEMCLTVLAALEHSVFNRDKGQLRP